MLFIPIAFGLVLIALIIVINVRARRWKDIPKRERAKIKQDLQNW